MRKIREAVSATSIVGILFPHIPMKIIKYAAGGIAVTAFKMLSERIFRLCSVLARSIPKIMPRIMTMTEPVRTIPRVVLPPSRILENSHRPRSSVPKGYSVLEGRYLARMFVLCGLFGLNKKPNKQNRRTRIGIP